MTQHELNLAVARATGESVDTIVDRGFSLVDPAAISFDPEPDDREPRVSDWDAYYSAC